MYAILREDLGLTPSQLAVQAGHAFVGSYASLPAPIQGLYSIQEGTKVILVVPDERAFVDLQRALSKARVPFWTAVEGPPCTKDLDGKTTAIGVGPVRRSTARPLLKNLRLLR